MLCAAACGLAAAGGAAASDEGPVGNGGSGDWATGYIDPADGKLVLPDTAEGRALPTRAAFRGLSFGFPVAGSRFHAIEYTEKTGLTDFRNRWRRNHMGTDIFAPEGRPVLAAGDGVVTMAVFTPKKGPGCKVAVYHGAGVYTYYLHMSAIYCREGDRVKRGDVIAAVGATGNAAGTPTHLHFEVDFDVETGGKPAWFRAYVNDPAPGIAGLRSVEPLAYVCKHAPLLRDSRPLTRRVP